MERTSLATRYQHKEVEEKWYKSWGEKGFFHPTADKSKKSYCIVIPPPNVTGILHMGHALNNTVQDILIRWKRMQGFPALWIPGTDHAGIATQNVVERKLAKEGIKRHDLGREKFIERVWEWRKEYGSTIISQLKKLGCSCDWTRERFTMDEGLSNAVQEVFIRLYEKGLIYQGDYIINWCPRCQTALSDEEAPHKEMEGKLYYIKYPIKDSNDFITVATTRPETMLGDVAVAANPKDERFSGLRDKTVILPIMERPLRVIYDELVDAEFGTGLVKVTPAHDPVDFQLAANHNLTPIKIMNPDATMSNEAGQYKGMDRFACREAIIRDLTNAGLIEKITAHQHAVGHCYRCHTMIEPYLSRQWFVKMKPLAEPGIRAVKEGRIRFYPERWTKVYLDWMENIRDWCISRQIWWGHRIPVWYCQNCHSDTGDGAGVVASRVNPGVCPRCNGKNFRQDEDVLDTWFSSWLWPFSTLGWPEKSEDLSYFYPTSTLVTAQEIIFFWVARMIMAGFEFMKDIPFQEVYIHGTVRDDTGAKMSKSLGNIIDPLEIIDEYGSDALRFSIISITAAGQDVFLSKQKFELGRNFANKIWNAARFVLMNLEDKPLPVERKEEKIFNWLFQQDLTLPDKWILFRLLEVTENITVSLEKYRFNEVANSLYDFFWHEYCDWYLETVKNRMKEGTVQVILPTVLEWALRLLHPYMPFITEEIWQKLPHDGESIMVSHWPNSKDVQESLPASLLSGEENIVKEMNLLIDSITAIRNIRAEVNLAPKQTVAVVISTKDEEIARQIREHQGYIKALARVEGLEIGKGIARPEGSAAAVTGESEIFLCLKGLVDLEAEKERLSRHMEKLNAELESAEAKLENPDFVTRAKPEAVEKVRSRAEELKATLLKVKENISHYQP